MLYILLIFCILLIVLLTILYKKWDFLKNKEEAIYEELSYYKEINKNLNEEIDELEKVLDSRKMQYEEELKNFRKVLKLYGTKQLNTIPYFYKCNVENIGRPYGEDKEVSIESEDYIIPQITIRFVKVGEENEN